MVDNELSSIDENKGAISISNSRSEKANASKIVKLVMRFEGKYYLSIVAK